jgi:agmatinase
MTENPALGSRLPAYAGITTFRRLEATRDLAGVDVAVVGLPFDSGAVSYRSGSRLGPRKIREVSPILWGYNSVLNVAPFEVLNVIDYGDVAVDPTQMSATLAAITSEVGHILDAGPTVIALGGDHSITLPLLRAHAAKFGPLAVVHFDSHSDTWEGQVDHSTPFRYAVNENLIDRRGFIQVGIRGPVLAARDLTAAQSLGAEVLRIEECLDRGIPWVVKAIRSRVGARPVYVSLDLDAADPAFAPGVGTPEVGGFTSYQMLQLVRGLCGLNLVGLDLVELCPPYDPGEITAILAANLAFEFLSLLALNKQARIPEAGG